MSSACTFVLLIWNQLTKSFRVYLDRIKTKDICFQPYDNHRQSCHLIDIAFYSKWLGYGSRLMYPCLPKWVMRQFGYMQVIPSDPFLSVPSTMPHGDVDAMYHGLLNHLVSFITLGIITENRNVTLRCLIIFQLTLHPEYMSVASRSCSVFSFRCWKCNCWLSLVVPWD